jgi:hypothetical protein
MTAPKGVARRGGRTVAAHLAAAVAWVAAAWLVSTRVIVAAYEGRSLAVFNRVLQGRTHHPASHYVELWNAFAAAVALAIGLHLALSLRLSLVETQDRRRLRAFVPAFLAVAVLAGARHDYVAYLEIWAATIRGGDPWQVSPRFGYPLNAYGPLFNAFAPLAWVAPLAPKLVFAGVYLAWVIETARAGGSRRAVVWAAAPFFWVEVAWFGHFDVLVGLSCALAVRLALDRRDGAAGLALGLGVLLKYLPGVLGPYLAFGRSPAKWRFVATACGLVALGLAVSVAVWGSSTIRPLAFAATRGSTLASIFRYLRGSYSPLRVLVASPDLDRYSTLFLALGLAAVFLACRWRRLPLDSAAAAGALTTVLLYRVGFPQYQTPVFMLLQDRLARRVEGRFERIAADAYIGAYSAFNLVYAYAGGVIHPADPLAWLDEACGLPAFALGGAVLAALVCERRPSSS